MSDSWYISVVHFSGTFQWYILLPHFPGGFLFSKIKETTSSLHATVPTTYGTCLFSISMQGNSLGILERPLTAKFSRFDAYLYIYEQYCNSTLYCIYEV